MTKTVAINEFVYTVKRPAWLIMTFGMPIILVLYAGVIGLIAGLAVATTASSLAQVIGIVDHSGLFQETDPTRLEAEVGEGDSTPSSFGSMVADFFEKDRDGLPVWQVDTVFFDSLDDALAALGRQQVVNVVVIPENYIATGELQSYVTDWNLIGDTGSVALIAHRLSDAVLAHAGLSADVIERLRSTPEVTIYEFDELEGTFVEMDKFARAINFGVPVGVAVLLIAALMMNAGFLAAGIGEEKENKIIEVLLASVRAEQLLLGKVLGLGAAALLQISIWLSMVGIFPLIMLLTTKQPLNLDIHAVDLVVSGLFFVLGFLFYGSLLVGLGSFGSNIKESQQYTIPIIMMPAVPLLAGMALISAPNGLVARMLSWFPPFAAPAMMFRLGSGAVPWWDIALSAILMLIGLWLAIVVSGRLFRAGTLMYGKGPNPIVLLKLLFRPG